MTCTPVSNHSPFWMAFSTELVAMHYGNFPKISCPWSLNMDGHWGIRLPIISFFFF